MSAPPPAAVVEVFRQLRSRRLALGYDELMALRTALRAGFGLRSRDAFVELCVTLWAKSPAEAATIRMLFDRHAGLPDWELALADPGSAPSGPTTSEVRTEGPAPRAPEPVPLGPPVTLPAARLGAVPKLPASSSRRIVLTLEFPLTRRSIAQAVRRLRQPVRAGPPTELDLEATVAKRARTGVSSPPVMVARRRNVSRILLLLDRQGSMAPLHPYLDHVRDAIAEDGRLARVTVRYFHNSFSRGADPRVLVKLSGLFPNLDPVLGEIGAQSAGSLYADPELLHPVPLDSVLHGTSVNEEVIVVSDAGAIRGGYDVERAVGTIAFARAVRTRGHRLVWLNPVPRRRWATTTAGELSRHIPMYPLDRAGLEQAVDVLRGKPPVLERPA